MALANVAFLAALNGKRVLVIDWDLEAPGLLYYFRGLIDPGVLRVMKERPGVLNMAWNWMQRTDAANSAEAIEQLIEEVRTASYFDNLICPVLGPQSINDVHLDVITPGAGEFQARDTSRVSLSYEAALADFSWTEFLNDRAGGLLLNEFRMWAKREYDLILIDSRTGLADDAGICTVQMPDAVALCFVLNRQNIDGISRIASVVQARRDLSVEIRAVPMRVASTNTAEEADAIVRAKRELARIGGLDRDQIDRDFASLAIRASAAVPYYESLAPMMANAPTRDPMTLNYLDLALGVVGPGLVVHDIDETWRDEVRRRLAPQHATVDYLEDLQNAEPERAASDLRSYLESARADALDGGILEPGYVRALATLALILSERIEPFEAAEFLHPLVELLRDLSAREPDLWRPHLIAALERYAALLGQLAYDEEEELSVLEELDALHATLAPNSDVALKRIVYHRHMARLCLQSRSAERAKVLLDELTEMLEEFRQSFNVSPGQLADFDVANVENWLLRGELAMQQQQTRAGIEFYQRALSQAELVAAQSRRSEMGRVIFDLCTRLAQSLPPDEGAPYALQALRSAPSSTAATANIVNLADVVLKSADAPKLVHEFVALAFPSIARRHIQSFANLYGRGGTAQRMLQTLLRLGEVASVDGNKGQKTLSILNEAITLVARSAAARMERIRGPSRDANEAIRSVLSRWREEMGFRLTPDDQAILDETLGMLSHGGSRE